MVVLPAPCTAHTVALTNQYPTMTLLHRGIRRMCTCPNASTTHIAAIGRRTIPSKRAYALNLFDYRSSLPFFQKECAVRGVAASRESAVHDMAASAGRCWSVPLVVSVNRLPSSRLPAFPVRHTTRLSKRVNAHYNLSWRTDQHRTWRDRCTGPR